MSLSLYLVTYYPVDPDDGTTNEQRTSLVIAETAQQAEDMVAIEGGRYVANNDSVGRLGLYDPGLEGHAMVMGRPKLILTEVTG